MTTATENAAELSRTESYALRRCEGYRVIGPDGPAGYVENIWTYEDGQVAALVVSGETRQIVRAADVSSVDDRAERLTACQLRAIGTL